MGFFRYWILFFLLITNLKVIGNWNVIPTGINDTLRGITVYKHNVVLLGDSGIYVSNNRFNDLKLVNVSNLPFQDIYKRTKFQNQYFSQQGVFFNDIIFIGQDTTTKNVVIFKMDVNSLELDIIYNSSSGTKIFGVSKDNNNGIYFVGTGGFLLEYLNNNFKIRDLGTERDLYCIDFSGSKMFIGGDSIALIGSKISNVLNLKSYITNYKISEVSIYELSGAYIANKEYYYFQNVPKSENLVNKPWHPLKANTLISIGGEDLIGTDKGILETNSNYSTLEYQVNSYNYHITKFFKTYYQDTIYAVGANGTILFTTNKGGITKPTVVSNIVNGTCVNQDLNIRVSKGSSNWCIWYMNGQYLSNPNIGSCNSFNHKMTSKGKFDFMVIGKNTNNGYSDTSYQSVYVVDMPKNDLPFQIEKDILCHNERLILNIDSTEKDVYYQLFQKENRIFFGSSINVGDAKLKIESNLISKTNDFYLVAQSSIANCKNNFTKTFNVKVEQTKASFHASHINSFINDTIIFYNKSKEFVKQDWVFPIGASIQKSNDSIVKNTFSVPGSKYVELKVESEFGCRDSIKLFASDIINKKDTQSCWIMTLDTIDTDSPETILSSLKTKNGYLVCGQYPYGVLKSRQGANSKKLDFKDGFLSNYSNDGVLLWEVRSYYDSPYNWARISNVIQLKSGNYVISGNGKYFKDNSGTVYQLDNNFIIILDSLGVLIDYYSSKIMIDKIQGDNDNNIWVVFSYPEYLAPEPFEIMRKDGSIYHINSTYTATFNTIVKFNEKFNYLFDMSLTNKVMDLDIDNKNNIHILYNKSIYDGVNLYSVVYLGKYDPNGNVLWYKTINEKHGKDIFASDLKVSETNNVYITGNSNSYSFEQGIKCDDVESSGGSYYFIKFSENGKCEWIKTSSNTSTNSIGNSITEENGHIYVLGRIDVLDRNNIQNVAFIGIENSINIISNLYNFFIAHYLENGEILEVILSGDVNYQSYSPIWLYNSRFFIEKNNFYFFTNIKNNPSKNVFFNNIVPETDGKAGLFSKFTLDCGITYLPDNLVYTNKTLNNTNLYPNPTTGIVTVESKLGISKIIIFDQSGKLINTFDNSSFSNKVNVKIEKSGVYYLQIFSNNNTEFSKVIVL